MLLRFRVGARFNLLQRRDGDAVCSLVALEKRTLQCVLQPAGTAACDYETCDLSPTDFPTVFSDCLKIVTRDGLCNVWLSQAIRQ